MADQVIERFRSPINAAQLELLLTYSTYPHRGASRAKERQIPRIIRLHLWRGEQDQDWFE
jgi:hypothetical protein